jgi:hypothetical protein
LVTGEQGFEHDNWFGRIGTVLLIDGVLLGAVTRPETHPAAVAREMAEGLLDTTSGAAAHGRSARGDM